MAPTYTPTRIEASRVARFAKLAFADGQPTAPPATDACPLFQTGKGAAAIAAAHPWGFTLVRMKPGQRTDGYVRSAEEVVFPLDGELRVRWGAALGRAITLKARDTLSVPPGAERALENAGKSDLHVLVMSGAGAADAKPAADLDESAMEATRVARFGGPCVYSDAFKSSHIPEFRKKIHKVINMGAVSNPNAVPAIKVEHPWTVSIIEMEPGKGAGLHSHTTEEVFFPLDGRFDMFWGDDGESAITLQRWDTISMPMGIMRGFKNMNDRTLHVLVMIGGENNATQGSIEYHESVVPAA